jgi:hypothetical protein
MTKTHTQVTVALTAAAIVLASILAVSPNATTIANEASGEIYGIDILSMTRNAKALPEQQFPAY